MRPQNLPEIQKLFGPWSLLHRHDLRRRPARVLRPRAPDRPQRRHRLEDPAQRRSPRELFGLFGSECGREWALPHSDFFEGLVGVSGQYFHNLKPESLGAKVIPFWEMVYHDCQICYGKYGYARRPGGRVRGPSRALRPAAPLPLDSRPPLLERTKSNHRHAQRATAGLLHAHRPGLGRGTPSDRRLPQDHPRGARPAPRGHGPSRGSGSSNSSRPTARSAGRSTAMARRRDRRGRESWAGRRDGRVEVRGRGASPAVGLRGRRPAIRRLLRQALERTRAIAQGTFFTLSAVDGTSLAAAAQGPRVPRLRRPEDRLGRRGARSPPRSRDSKAPLSLGRGQA